MYCTTFFLADCMLLGLGLLQLIGSKLIGLKSTHYIVGAFSIDVIITKQIILFMI